MLFISIFKEDSTYYLEYLISYQHEERTMVGAVIFI